MKIRKSLFSAGICLLFSLTACSSNQVESSGTDSPQPSTVAASESPEVTVSEETSPAQTSPEQPSPAAPSPVQTAPTTNASSEESTAEVAAPGTKCGSTEGSNTVFVFGGPVSCDTALGVMNEFEPLMTGHVGGLSGATELIQNTYTCQESSQQSRDTGTYAVCKGEQGEHFELRTGMDVLPGPVANTEEYFTAEGGTAFSYAFNIAGGSSVFACSVNGGALVECETLQRGHEYGPTWKVSMDAESAAVPSEGFRNDPTLAMLYAKPLDVGTTINFQAVSCQPETTDSIRCINPNGNGFVISPDGVSPV